MSVLATNWYLWIGGFIAIVTLFKLFGAKSTAGSPSRTPPSEPFDKASLPAGVPDVIQQLIESGNQIGAIKELRNATGMDLVHAKNAISSWKQETSGDQSHIKTVYSTGTLPPDIIDLVKNGKRIEAVRRLRQEAGMSTSAARAAVDALTEPAAASATFNAPESR